MERYHLILNLFGEGGGEGTGESGAAAGAQDAAQTEAAQPADRAAKFRELIKGEYKDEFQRVMQDNLSRRFKETEELRKNSEAAKPLFELLAGKYGVKDASDVNAIREAAEADDGYYEEEAAEKGLTVEQLKNFKRMERENAQLREAAQERERVERANQVQARWAQEAEQTKAIYSGFDFATEAQNPQFAKMLKAGVDVRTAYEVAHHDDILSGAIQFAVQKTQEKTVNDIRTRGMRPDEGALGSRSAGDGHMDVSRLTKQQRADLAKRALRGEHVTFTEGG